VGVGSSGLGMDSCRNLCKGIDTVSIGGGG